MTPMTCHTMTPVTYSTNFGSVTVRCQESGRTVLAVSGVAGSGKSTLGLGLATALRSPLLDLDTLTVPLLDRLHGTVLTEHWLASAHGSIVREGRYAALRAVAAEAVATAGSAVLVAPFTAELTGGPEWDMLIGALAPVELHMIYLRGSAELFARRRANRAASRDRHRPAEDRPISPAVPHIGIDAELNPAQQLFRALRATGHRIPLDRDSPVFNRTYEAILFDLDGVLADSTASVMRCWARFSREHELAAAAVESNHGRTARALVEQLVAADRVEDGLRRIEALEVDDAANVAPVPGARELMSALPESRRAIATSGTRRIATARLAAIGIAPPRVLVTADDIRRGKPDPEPYLRAAARLGKDPGRCLVIEDAPAGIAAARAAGCGVVAVLGTAEPPELQGADLVVDGLDRLKVALTENGLRLSPS